ERARRRRPSKRKPAGRRHDAPGRRVIFGVRAGAAAAYGGAATRRERRVDRPDRMRKGSLLLAAQHQLRQPLNALSLLIGELKHASGAEEIGSIAEDMAVAARLQNTWLDALSELEAAALGVTVAD